MNEYVRKPAGNALGDIIKNKISDTASERIEIYALYFYVGAENMAEKTDYESSETGHTE